MTPERQRIAIAEACGWKRTPRFDYENHLGKQEIWELEGRLVSRDHGMPDYLNDLNAMFEAEKTMTVDQKHDDYQSVLHDVVSRDREGLTLGDVWYLQIHATAAQRAEAFLRTICKWEDA